MNAIHRKISSVKVARFLLLSLLFSSIGFATGVLILNPANLRLLLFGGIFIGLVAVSHKWPIAVLYFLTIYLPLMGLFRRLLIPFAGWNSSDPLVILPPFVLGMMVVYRLYRHSIDREPFLNDTKLYKMIRWFMIIILVQAANPMSHGMMDRINGLLLYLIPLFWMVLARNYITEKHMKRLVGIVFALGCFAALYGLKQTYMGFFSFEYTWVQVGGYDALMISPTIIRAFSSFSNASEYAFYVVFTIITAWVIAIKGQGIQRIVAILVLPVLWYALFMESSRTPLVFTMLASAIVAIVQAKPGKARWRMAWIAIIAVAVVYIGLTSIAHNGNPILAHQVEGLSNPLNEEDSTATLHYSMFIEGIVEGFTFPIGKGYGMNMEYDISNIFLSTGIVGGLIYLFIYIKVYRLAYSFSQTEGKLGLILFGTLCASPGLWLIGGNYSTSAWVWALIGYLDIVSREHKINRIADRYSP